MSDLDDLLESANTLFLKKQFTDAISTYKKIIDLDPSNLIAINNLGYALSKSKDYQNAISYYDYGLRQHPNEKTLLINKISASRKMAMLDYALDSCNTILSKSPNDLIVLYHKLRILYALKEYEQSLENDIDTFESELSELTNFILPGGTLMSSILHLSRTIARRAETHVIALSQKEEINKIAIVYLNRLSDLLFVLARVLNKRKNIDDIVWKR